MEGAVQVVEEVFRGMRTEGLHLMNNLTADFNFDAKELRRRLLAMMAEPLEVDHEQSETRAEEFSRDGLPT